MSKGFHKTECKITIECLISFVTFELEDEHEKFHRLGLPLFIIGRSAVYWHSSYAKAASADILSITVSLFYFKW